MDNISYDLCSASRTLTCSGVSSNSIFVICFPGITTSPINRLVISTLTFCDSTGGGSFSGSFAPEATSFTAEGVGKRYSYVFDRMIFRFWPRIKDTSQLEYIAMGFLLLLFLLMVICPVQGLTIPTASVHLKVPTNKRVSVVFTRNV